MKIGLLDHMGYGNLGDAATQDALIGNIRKRIRDATFVGFSLNPEDTRRRHDIVCYPITWWHPGLATPAPSDGEVPPLRARIETALKAIPLIGPALRTLHHLGKELRHIRASFAVLRSLDCLIISGGGQLGDLWRGPWSHPYNVFKFARLARIARVPLLFVNVGAGPLGHPLSRWFVKWAVRAGDYVSFRDRESQALVESLGVTAATHVFPDSVYALDLSEAAGRPSTAARGVVGLNPIGFADPRIWPHADGAAYRDYLDTLTAFALWLRSQNYTVKIFSAEQSVDIHAIADLRRRLADSLPPGVVDEIVGSPAADVRTLIAEMSQFDFVVTSKFHGVVFSHLLQKPVVAISYHNKIDDLMRATGDTDRCLAIADFRVDDLKRAFASAVEHAVPLRRAYHRLARERAAVLASQFDDVFTPERLEPGRPTVKVPAVSEPHTMTSTGA